MPESLTSREEKIKLLQAIEERKRRKRAAPLFYAEPHGKQVDFIRAQGEKRIVLMSGSNRSGKTWVAGVDAVEFAYGYRIHQAAADGAIDLTAEGDYPPREAVPPKYWIRRLDGPPLRDQRSILVVTGLTMEKGIGQILWPEIEGLLPLALRSRLHVARGPHGVPHRISHPDGSWQIHFGSIQQGSMVFEGQKVDYAHFDEPPSRTVFTAVWRGCIDYFASVGFTFTPLGHDAPWLYEEFYVNERDDVAIVEVAPEDNPHVTAEAFAAFTAGVALSEEEELARTRGKFGFLTHRAFQNYDRNVHLIEPFDIPREWPRACWCDPASRRPYYFLWAAFDVVNKSWVVYREFPYDKLHHQYRSSSWTIEDYATILRNLEGQERVDCRVIDPRFGVAEYSIKGQKVTSVVEDFAKFGIYFDPRVPDTGREETGIERIRQLLHYDTKLPIGPFNRPKLFIFNTVKSLPHSMENYAFVAPNARDDRVLAEKTGEAFKDPVDTLRYGILYGPPARMSDQHNSYIKERDFLAENAIDDDWL